MKERASAIGGNGDSTEILKTGIEAVPAYHPYHYKGSDIDGFEKLLNDANADIKVMCGPCYGGVRHDIAELTQIRAPIPLPELQGSAQE